jgi:hypothetical protein
MIHLGWKIVCIDNQPESSRAFHTHLAKMITIFHQLQLVERHLFSDFSIKECYLDTKTVAPASDLAHNLTSVFWVHPTTTTSIS